MKSTLLNMTAVLFGITLAASAGVGVVNMITEEPIAAAKEAATKAALTEVLPAFDATEAEELTIDEMPITVYTATKEGAVSGYAVQSMTKQGFGGVVRLMVGFTPEGEVVNVNVLEQTETPGRCVVWQGSVEQIIFAKDWFDAVTAFETVYFWPDLPRCFREVYRVLKPGGTLLICNESNGDTDKDKKWTEIIGGMTIYKDAELKAYLEQAGFHEVQIHKKKSWLCITARK